MVWACLVLSIVAALSAIAPFALYFSDTAAYEGCGAMGLILPGFGCLGLSVFLALGTLVMICIAWRRSPTKWPLVVALCIIGVLTLVPVVITIAN